MEVAGRQVFNIHELGCYLSMSRYAVQKLVAKGALPTPIKIGRSYVWFRDSVDFAIETIKTKTQRNITRLGTSSVAGAIPYQEER